MKSGIEVDDEKQQKIKGGYCVCYCDIGRISSNVSKFGVAGDDCRCSCTDAQSPGMQQELVIYRNKY
jgi:hypothetical protein